MKDMLSCRTLTNWIQHAKIMIDSGFILAVGQAQIICVCKCNASSVKMLSAMQHVSTQSLLYLLLF